MTASSTPQDITQLRKAAILLITLGEDVSAELMRQLSQDEVKRLCEETARVKEFNGEQTELVLREFYQLTSRGKERRAGGLEFTHRMLSQALGTEGARKLLADAADPVGASFARLEPLVKSDAAQVARSLCQEHPQTIALIAAQLSIDQAAVLLGEFPSELRTDVTLRMARLDHIAPEVLAQIAETVAERFGKQTSLNRKTYDGLRMVADLCNRFNPEMSQEVLQGIEETSPETVERIRKIMFVFDDVLRLDDAAISEINSRIDRKTLVMALKGTSGQLKEHFTKKMSSRARDMLLEDLDALGPVKVRDVEEAQQEVITIIRQLEQEGVISSRGSEQGGGDGYVS